MSLRDNIDTIVLAGVSRRMGDATSSDGGMGVYSEQAYFIRTRELSAAPACRDNDASTFSENYARPHIDAIDEPLTAAAIVAAHRRADPGLGGSRAVDSAYHQQGKWQRNTHIPGAGASWSGSNSRPSHSATRRTEKRSESRGAQP